MLPIQNLIWELRLSDLTGKIKSTLQEGSLVPETRDVANLADDAHIYLSLWKLPGETGEETQAKVNLYKFALMWWKHNLRGEAFQCRSRHPGKGILKQFLTASGGLRAHTTGTGIGAVGFSSRGSPRNA